MTNPATYTPESLLAALQAVAADLSLPGSSISRSAMIKKKGKSAALESAKPAPSLALIKRLMEGMPNPDNTDRNKQVGVAHAVKGAVKDTTFEGDGRDLFLAWSSKWYGSDPVEDERIYDTLGPSKNDWSSLLLICRDLAPSLAHEIRCAEAKEIFSAAVIPPGLIDAIAARRARSKSSHALDGLVLAPVTAPAAADIPPRQWLYGHHLIAGSLSLTVAPGGTGKSVLTMAEAVAMACGETLYPSDVPQRALRVWVHNAEDPQDELNRRLAAIMKRYDRTDADLGGRLFMSSGRDIELCLAKMFGGEPRVELGIEDKLVEFIQRHRIDVLVLDPLGAVHALPENDNTAVNVLLGALRRVMNRTNIAIQAVHHTGKQAASDMKGSGAAAARGASAWVDGARNVRQLGRMTEKEASNLGIPAEEAFKYIRVDNGKANLAPATKAVWRKIESEQLGNCTPEYPSGDNVGVPVTWSPPRPMSSTVTSSDLQQVQAAIITAAQVPRASEQSPDWVGYLVAGVLSLDVGEPGSTNAGRSPQQNRARYEVKGLIKGWRSNGGLIQANEPNPNSRKASTVPVIHVGHPAVCLPDEGSESAST